MPKPGRQDRANSYERIRRDGGTVYSIQDPCLAPDPYDPAVKTC